MSKSKKPETAVHAGAAVGAPDRGRYSARRKTEAVLRLLKGEPLDAISREIGVAAAMLSEWREEFVFAGTAGLQSKAPAPADDEVRRLSGPSKGRVAAGRARRWNDRARQEAAKFVECVAKIVNGIPRLEMRRMEANEMQAWNENIANLRARAWDQIGGEGCERLRELRAVFAPTARVPSACGLSATAALIADPVFHFFECDRFCVECRVEAEREIDLILAGIRAGKPCEPFIEPGRLSIRVRQANYRAERDRRTYARLIKEDEAGRRREARENAKAKRGQSATHGARVKTRSHSADFTSVKWDGESFTFSRSQARVVSMLWEEWEHCEGGLSEATIGDRLRGDYPGAFRLRDVFRPKNGAFHPAWKTMVVQLRPGVYGLRSPKSQKSPR